MKNKQLVYHRYHIETKKAPNIVPHPYRFQVKVNKFRLAKLLLKELFHYRGQLDVVASRPCVYGVFSGPIGGFAPREHLCVGCLRCTTQYPDMVQIVRNPERSLLGDHYLTAEHIHAIIYEAENGRIPIRGAGYRGPFGGEGWDGMWMDMSEIVRPTRDGIHGREFISTEVDIGEKLPFLEFDANKQPTGSIPRTISIPLPILFDAPPPHLLNCTLCHILSKSAHHLQTFTILPFESLLKCSLQEESVIPLLDFHDFEEFKQFDFNPTLLEMANWNEKFYQSIRTHFPNTLVMLRTHFENDLLHYYQAGVRIFHLVADYHGRGESGQFVLDLICKAHRRFVQAGCRDEVTLIGSGGLIAAEHIAKGIICGLDAIGLDTATLVALQGKFEKCLNDKENDFQLPKGLTVEWGVQRLKNLASSWRDQLLEVLGAMGMREVRRMRGELGRAFFQKDLEREAFKGIRGYEG